MLPIVILVSLYITFTFNNRPPTIAIPTPVPPGNNGYNDFVRAAQMIRTIQHKAPASMPAPPTTRAGYLAQTKACTQESAAGLAVLRNGFSKPYMMPPERDGSNSFPRFAEFREMARTITGVAIYYELTGQPGRAADVLLDGEEMGVTIPRGSGVIGDLVGIAVEAISLNRFEKLLPKLSQQELAHVALRLEQISAKRVPYSDIMLEQGFSSVSLLRMSFRDPKSKTLQGSYDTARTLLLIEGDKRPTAKQAWKMARMMMKNKTDILNEELRFFKELAAESKTPFAVKSKVAIPGGGMMDHWYEMYTSNRGRSKHVAHESILNLLRIETALYQYKAANGKFPPSLLHLSPTFLRSIPIDPFTGSLNQPYHYSLLKSVNGFMLYGLGPDMSDHGGQFGRYALDDGFDIVAEHISRGKELPQ